MRILLIGPSPSVGMQFYTAGLANTLVSETGNDVWVIGAATRRATAFDKRVSLVTAYSFSTTGLSRQALNPVRFWKLLKRIDDIRPDLVHVTGPHLWNLPMTRCLRRRYPLVFTVHEPTPHKGAPGPRVKNLYQRIMARFVDRVVVHSEEVKRSVMEAWGGPATRFSVMPLVNSGFDYERHQQVRSDQSQSFSCENMALLFGRLEEYKGIREFIEAARLLSSSGDQIKMVVAGTGGMSQELEEGEYPSNLEVRNRLIEDDEVIDLFGRASLVVLPYSEGSQSAIIPLAYLFRKPVLVTRVGALPEYVIDGLTGRIIDANEPGLLAQTIRDMMADAQALAEMGRASRGYLLELERQLSRKLLETYTGVLEEKA